MDEIELLDIIAGLQQVEEDRLIHALLAEFEMIPMDRRFCAVLLRDIVPGTPRGQDIQDAVQELPGVAPGTTNMRFLGREMLPDNLPEIVVDFLKRHAPALGCSRVL
ncbi:MAG: hypothetical protein QMD46_08555 [Methanomicrobiales archaeon]|nr:hypothetical protein [Methanomicrobiales archaeon]